MKTALILAGLISVAATIPAAAQDAHAILRAADQAIGASKVNSIQYIGAGYVGTQGQNYSVYEDPARFELKSWMQTIDYNAKAMKEDQVRIQGKYPRRGGGQTIPDGTQMENHTVVNDTFAWNINARGAVTPANGQAAQRQFAIWLTPHGFVRAALAAQNVTMVERNNAVTGKTTHLVSLTIGRNRAVGEINEQNVVERVYTWQPNNIMGDMQVEYSFSDWRDAGNGIKVPYHIHQNAGESVALQRTSNAFDALVTGVKVNVPTPALAVPDNVRNAPQAQAGGGGVNIETKKLADKVSYMTGGNYSTYAVELKDYIVLIEAPQGDAWMEAVFNEMKKDIPNKKVKYVFNTHRHSDHSGGVRRALAEGAIIITNEMNRDYFERVVLGPQPRSLGTDRLAQFPLSGTDSLSAHMQYYRDQYTVTDGDESITAYRVDNNHAADMSVIYIGKEKILINGDMWAEPTPGESTPPSPNAIALYDAIKFLGIDVAMHGSTHSGVGPNSTFERIVGPLAARQSSASAGR